MKSLLTIQQTKREHVTYSNSLIVSQKVNKRDFPLVFYCIDRTILVEGFQYIFSLNSWWIVCHEQGRSFSSGGTSKE